MKNATPQYCAPGSSFLETNKESGESDEVHGPSYQRYEDLKKTIKEGIRKRMRKGGTNKREKRKGKGRRKELKGKRKEMKRKKERK